MIRLVSPGFRQLIIETFPLLQAQPCSCTREAHMEMMRLALFSFYKDEETSSVRFGAETIARAYNRLDSFVQGNFNAGALLKHFVYTILQGAGEIVLDEEGREWSTGTYEEYERFDGSMGFFKTEKGKQRRVKFNWPQHILDAVTEELNSPLKREEKVYFITGLKYSRTTEKKALEDLRVDAEEIEEVLAVNNKASKYMIRYLNGLPTNKFHKLLDNMFDARAVLNALPISEYSKKHQGLILSSIAERPIPVYKPTQNSLRLYTMGPSLQNLKKEVRKALTKDWIEADLSNAQLAIVGKLWGVSSVNNYLKTVKSVWSGLINFMGLSHVASEVKGTLKDHTYGLVFGMAKERIVRELDLALGKYIDNAGEKFLSFPILRDLLSARTRIINQYMTVGFAIDAFGDQIKVTKKNVLTVLAQVAQSYETLLIYPAFEIASRTDEMSITLLSHDGFSFTVSNNAHRAYWIERVTEAVNNRAIQMGILTHLEVLDLSVDGSAYNLNHARDINEYDNRHSNDNQNIHTVDDFNSDLFDYAGEVHSPKNQGAGNIQGRQEGRDVKRLPNQNTRSKSGYAQQYHGRNKINEEVLNRHYDQIKANDLGPNILSFWVSRHHNSGEVYSYSS